VRADPSVVRALWEGSFVFYGAIGLWFFVASLAMFRMRDRVRGGPNRRPKQRHGSEPLSAMRGR
jgi:hypothetical protein